MGKKLCAACLSAVLTVSSLFAWQETPWAAGNALPFDDLGEAYAQKEILELFQQSIVNGTGNRTFEPDKTVTRAEFAAMLMRMLHMEPVMSTVTPFSDTPRDAWYYGWVQAALNLGIAEGTGADSFSPDLPLTREQSAALLVKAVKQPDAASETGLRAYADAAAIAPWARVSVATATTLGLMQGDDRGFRPLDGITRQEAAVVLSRLLHRPGWEQGSQAADPEGIQMGWLYDQPLEETKRSPGIRYMNTLSPSWLFLDKTGALSNGTVTPYVDWAHNNGKKIWPLVGNRFNADNTHRLLSDPAARQAFVQKLANAVKIGRLDGLNIDFENMLPADRNDFTAFIRELGDALHAAGGAKLSVNVPPDLGNSWSDPYDFASLARFADYIVFMGYEEHWSGDPEAGSVSSAPWLEQSVANLLRNIPADRFIVGLPFYTRDWFTANGKTESRDLSLAEQAALIQSRPVNLQWLPAEGQYSAEYWDGSEQHRIWAEDSRSLALKTNVMLESKAAGAAYWYAGSATPDVWPAIGNQLRYGKIQPPSGSN